MKRLLTFAVQLYLCIITGIEKCRTNGGSIRKINCKRKRKHQERDYIDHQDHSNHMTCCCHVKCDPIEKPAKELLDEYLNVR